MLIEEPFTGENVARSVRLGDSSKRAVWSCWSVEWWRDRVLLEKSGMINDGHGFVYCFFFRFFQTVSEKKHEWLAGFLSTCDSCNMWFFCVIIMMSSQSNGEFPSQVGSISVRAYQVGTLPRWSILFPPKKCKRRTEFFLGKKTNTAGWFFSVNFTVQQDLLIRRSLYLHPFFWTTQYGMVLQQILGIQQNLGKSSETWWADQILQVWKIRMMNGVWTSCMSWVRGRSGSQVVRRPTLHL